MVDTPFRLSVLMKSKDARYTGLTSMHHLPHPPSLPPYPPLFPLLTVVHPSSQLAGRPALALQSHHRTAAPPPSTRKVSARAPAPRQLSPLLPHITHRPPHGAFALSLSFSQLVKDESNAKSTERCAAPLPRRRSSLHIYIGVMRAARWNGMGWDGVTR